MSAAVIGAALAVVAAMALLAEGWTVLRCVASAGPGGAERLSRLGAGFLATEVWVVALLGLGHAAVPGWVEAPALLVPLCGYVAGWVLRDLGLWSGPRLVRQWPARVAVVVGAVIQLVSVVGGVMGVGAIAVSGGTDARFAPDPLLAPTAVFAVLATLVLQVVWWAMLHGRGAPWFRWG